MAEKILIVEDDPLVRMCTADGLEDLGYEVFEAGDAHQAFEVLTSQSEIRLLFTDINMPGMDGINLAHAVSKRWPPVKLVLTSALPLSRGIPLGAKFYTKPYAVCDMHEVFHAMLNGKMRPVSAL